MQQSPGSVAIAAIGILGCAQLANLDPTTTIALWGSVAVAAGAWIYHRLGRTKVEKFFERAGEPLDLIGHNPIDDSDGIRYILKLPIGKSHFDFVKFTDALQQYLHADRVDIYYRGNLIIDIYGGD